MTRRFTAVSTPLLLQGELLLLSEDGLKHLQLGASILVDPNVDQLIEPADDRTRLHQCVCVSRCSYMEQI